MYTCDLCGEDCNSPWDLIRVWLDKGDYEKAILVCDECLGGDAVSGEYLTYAEDDPHWEYLAVRSFDPG